MLGLEDLQVALNHWLRDSGRNRIEAPETLSTPPIAPGPLELFDAPLLGVAGAADPLWTRFKDPEVIGPHHLKPEEWLPGARTAVCFFLPFSLRVRTANRIPVTTPTEWLYGRYEGQLLVEAMTRHLAGLLQAEGWQAVTPAIDPRFRVLALRSNWSERHAAFTAGLGTLSLSRHIITRAGSAGRLGSVITDAPLPPTLRPYQEPEEYCGKCGACIPRCPCDAIDDSGKDNLKCKTWVDEVLAVHKPRYGCGKCTTKVSCESGIPRH